MIQNQSLSNDMWKSKYFINPCSQQDRITVREIITNTILNQNTSH